VKLDADHGAPLCDYFAAIGADCATLRQVDFYVGGCVFNVAAPARERADTFAFGFAGDRGGKPRLLPPLPPGEVDDILLWAHDPPGGRVRDDGRRGVRVNVDGRLVGEIKRDLLEGSLEPIAAPREGQAPRYRLLDFLAVRALDIDRIRGIDLIVRDERVVRLTPDEVATGLEFTAADPGRGEMLFYFGTASARALAVDVWAHTDPPARPIRFAAALGAATAVGGATLHAALRRAPDRR